MSLAVCAYASAAMADVSECAEAKANPYPAPHYVRMICDAERQIAAGNLEYARTSTLRALQVEFHEVQNYVPVIMLAEIACLSGDKGVGMNLIRDFECMLDIETGDRQCYSGDGPFAHGTVPNDVTPLCFNRMCGEIYLSYYLDPTDATIAYVDRLRQETARVRGVCG